jgi:ATP phosphoribosyltransferase
MNDTLVLAVPSKGRLMDQTANLFAGAGMTLRKVGSERGYRGEIVGLEGVEVTYVSASEIASLLAAGRAHIGITGEDLIREQIADAEERVTLLAPLGFGRADVVVAVPATWIDVRRMADLESAAMVFQRVHGRRLRVATKYMNLTRRYFAAKGVTGYRIVESLGATEGTPAAGAAELIVDITTTGTTLKANGLKVLEDGVILKSQAHLVASNAAPLSPAARSLQQALVTALRPSAETANVPEK